MENTTNWYETEEFLEVEKKFTNELPEGVTKWDSYLNLLWCAYNCGVNDGKILMCK
jgi:hypothetical protein